MKSVNWRTSPKSWDELIQITDGYVVHARGFTVGNDIWLDEYNVKGEHKKWWNQELQDEYNYSWKDESVLYWSITGSKTFIVQFPRYCNRGDIRKQFYITMNALDIPDNVSVTWKNSTNDVVRMEVGEI